MLLIFQASYSLSLYRGEEWILLHSAGKQMSIVVFSLSFDWPSGTTVSGHFRVSAFSVFSIALLFPMPFCLFFPSKMEEKRLTWKISEVFFINQSELELTHEKAVEVNRKRIIGFRLSNKSYSNIWSPKADFGKHFRGRKVEMKCRQIHLLYHKRCI